MPLLLSAITFTNLKSRLESKFSQPPPVTVESLAEVVRRVRDRSMQVGELARMVVGESYIGAHLVYMAGRAMTRGEVQAFAREIEMTPLVAHEIENVI